MFDIHSAAMRNLVLAKLPPGSLARVLPLLEPVELPIRLPLYRQGTSIAHVYFPLSGLISLVAILTDGTEAEVGIIGREGMLGSSLLSGIRDPFVDSLVQMPGQGLRMSAADFLREVRSDDSLREVLLRYHEALGAQIMQTAVCAGRHALEPRLARWLLMAHDRAEGDHLHLTQEFLAMMLGVHRPSISVTAQALQRAGLIRYAGGIITIVNRAGLERTACECYAAVQSRYYELMERKLD